MALFHLFHLVWEILNVFMQYLPDKKLRHFQASGYESDWFVGIVFNHSLDLTNKYASSLLIWTISETSKQPYHRNHNYTDPILFVSFTLYSDWHRTTETFGLNLQGKWPAVQHTVPKFLGEIIASYCCFPHSLTDCCLLHKRQNLKESAFAKLIIWNGENVPWIFQDS